jgi:branched-chain amino acid transport system substrate-binding protein
MDSMMTAPLAADRRTALKMAAAGAAGLFAPAIVRAADQKPIVLGFLLPLTGPNGAWGQTAWNGAQLGCKLINAQGGIRKLGGALLKPIVADTESKPQVAGSQAEKLVRDGALVMQGTNQSAATSVATQVSERHGIPFICPADIDPFITSRGFKNVFRTCALMPDYARGLLGYAKRMGVASGNPVQKIGVLCENSPPGKAAVDAVKAVVADLGLEVGDISLYDSPGTQNFTSYIAKYKGAGIDVVVGYQGPNDAIQIVRTMKELNYNPKLVGGLIGAYASSQFIATLGADGNALYGTDSYSPRLKLPIVKTLTEGYEKEYGKPLDSTAASALNGLSVTWDALERTASLDLKALHDAIAATQLKLGDRFCVQANGIRFGPTGENVDASSIVVMVKDGVPECVSPEEFASIKGVYPKPAWPT